MSQTREPAKWLVLLESSLKTTTQNGYPPQKKVWRYVFEAHPFWASLEANQTNTTNFGVPVPLENNRYHGVCLVSLSTSPKKGANKQDTSKWVSQHHGETLEKQLRRTKRRNPPPRGPPNFWGTQGGHHHEPGFGLPGVAAFRARAAMSLATAVAVTSLRLLRGSD